MSDAGDLLELLHGAYDRWTTAQFTLVRWHRTENADLQEHRERVWLAKPDRHRHEFGGNVMVQRGGVFWSYAPGHGYSSNERDPDMQTGDPARQYAAHLDPATLLHQARFERVERTLVRALPRATPMHGAWLPRGADEHLLTIDPERGVVLAIESRVDGDVFAVTALEDTVWDEALDDELFMLELPPGKRWRSPREHRSQVDGLEEASERASFPVFAIGDLQGDDWQLDVHHHVALDEDAPEAVTILYAAEGKGSLQVHQQAAGVSHPWTRLLGSAFYSTERDGTHITLQSQVFTEGELATLARSLVRV